MMNETNLIVNYTRPDTCGRTIKGITCPFCNKEYEVFWWSFCGVGKKCVCGARLGRMFCKKEYSKLNT